ncbi:MAG: hypothetical protein R6X02_35940 [Enhygromyxa sp.]
MALRTPELWSRLTYESACSSWGDVGAASAVLGAVLAVRGFLRGYARGARAMVMAGCSCHLGRAARGDGD